MTVLVSRGKKSGKKGAHQAKMSTLSVSLSDSMTVVELGQWLVDNGFSEDIRQRFESN